MGSRDEVAIYATQPVISQNIHFRDLLEQDRVDSRVDGFDTVEFKPMELEPVSLLSLVQETTITHDLMDSIANKYKPEMLMNQEKSSTLKLEEE